MATVPVRARSAAAAIDRPAYQAFLLLRGGFVIAPILFGLALRDLGLLLAALALARLATALQPSRDGTRA